MNAKTYLDNFPLKFRDQFCPTLNSIKCPKCKNIIYLSIYSGYCESRCCSMKFSYFDDAKDYVFYFSNHLNLNLRYSLKDELFGYPLEQAIHINLDFSSFENTLSKIENLKFYG